MVLDPRILNLVTLKCFCFRQDAEYEYHFVIPTYTKLDITAITERTIKTHDIAFIIIDMEYGVSASSKYLNFEDVNSKARDFWLTAQTDILQQKKDCHICVTVFRIYCRFPLIYRIPSLK